jgi:hypothetical protein
MDDAVKTQLTEYARSQAGTRIGRTLGALTRSDRDRLDFWTGPAVAHGLVEAMDRPGQEEGVVIAATARFGELRAAIGFVLSEGVPATTGAWLVLNGGAIIDPARSRRTLLGCLGVALTPGEVARWTPSQPSRVAERDVHRLRATA